MKKRITVDGEIKVIEVDLVLLESILVEKGEEMYNVYFPVSKPDFIYSLGVSIPIDMLDAYVTERINQNLIKVNEKSGVKSVLNDSKSTDEKVKDLKSKDEKVEIG